MNVVTAVDPRWLAELGDVFFSIKEKQYGSGRRAREEASSRQVELEKEMQRDRELKFLMQQKANQKEKMRTVPEDRIATPGLQKRTSTPLIRSRRFGI